jgi:hypothetical protein
MQIHLVGLISSIFLPTGTQQIYQFRAEVIALAIFLLKSRAARVDKQGSAPPQQPVCRLNRRGVMIVSQCAGQAKNNFRYEMNIPVKK